MCSRHYQSWHRLGDPLAASPRVNGQEAFWRKVDRTGQGCWLWPQPGIGAKGYGVFKIAGKSRGAHRVAWEFTFGAIPEGMKVCHRCDTPACVRPDHLFLGTDADNSADKVAKGRSLRGSRNTKAKLTEADVVEIRRLVAHGAVQRAVARQFGINHLTVHRIVHRQSWRHVA